MSDLGMPYFSALGLESTVPGTLASQWAEPTYFARARIVSELTLYPSIDIIHMSLGGNDLLDDWQDWMRFDPVAENAMFSDILTDVEEVIDFCLSIRPNIKVGLSSYDYMRKTRGAASMVDLNAATIRFATMARQMCESKDRVVFVNCLGITQWTFGDANAVPPYAPHTVPYPGHAPDYDPFPGGDPLQPGPLDQITPDGIHLFQQGYDALATHVITNYYGQWLDPFRYSDNLPVAAWPAAVVLLILGPAVLRRRRPGS
jgi:hypothetical protein